MKLGVVTKHNGGPCPKCGKTPKQENDGTWVCPKCGTRPFEVVADANQEE